MNVILRLKFSDTLYMYMSILYILFKKYKSICRRVKTFLILINIANTKIKKQHQNRSCFLVFRVKDLFEAPFYYFLLLLPPQV